MAFNSQANELEAFGYHRENLSAINIQVYTLSYYFKKVWATVEFYPVSELPHVTPYFLKFQ